MAEYIEREAAENAIRNDLPLSTWMKRSVDKAAHAMGVTVDAIEAIPAADVVEVRHGRWEERIVDDPLDPYGFFKRRWYCSSCGRYQTYGTTAFCPKCGAKMTEDYHEQKE